MTSNDFDILKYHWSQSTPSESMIFFKSCFSARRMFGAEHEWCSVHKGLAVRYSWEDAPILNVNDPKPDAVLNIEGQEASWYIWLFDEEN